MNETWRNVAKVLLVILLGFVGMGLFSLAQHIYQDHQNIHAVFKIIQEAQKTAAKPAQ